MSKSQRELRTLMRSLCKKDTHPIPSVRYLHCEEEECVRLWAVIANIDIPDLSLVDGTTEVWKLVLS